ncbi:MAG: uroporphyrinogen decarboxylase family protein [Candidatus Poribacteria bacterium]
MSPRERILKALKGQKVDRVPIVLPGFICASHDDLDRMKDPFRKRIAERIIDETVFMFDVPSYINRMLVTPPQRFRAENKDLPNRRRQTLGIIDTPLGELTYITEWDPLSATSWQVKYPVENEDDIKKIASVPWELPTNIFPPNITNLPKEFSERGIMSTHISSPFVCVAGMMEYERFLELCFLDLDLIKELTEICRQRILDCLKVLFSKQGIEYLWIGGSEWVTPPMASPDIYDELVQKPEGSLFQYIKSVSNAAIHVHCHGRIRDALPKTIERGGDYTEPVEAPPDGDITMAEAKEISAGRITLGGNIECRILYNGNEDDVEKAVRSAFEGGKDRFILEPTAEASPAITEQEFKNYMRLIDVWEELSPM